MRKTTMINQNWFFAKHFLPSHLMDYDCLDNFESIVLPHTIQEVPYHYFDEQLYQIKSTYKYFLDLSEINPENRIFLAFEGIMSNADIYWDQKHLFTHKGGFTPFMVELTPYVTSPRGVITVVVDASEDPNVPPFGYVLDFLTFGGIYREASVYITENSYIKDAYITCKNPLEEQKNLQLQITFDCIQTSVPNIEFKLLGEIWSNQQVISTQEWDLILKDGVHTLVFDWNQIDDLKNWDMDHPHLYEFKLHLYQSEVIDTYLVRTGFREIKFTAEGFYLNGVKVNLRGLNRHQSYPHVGYAMPKRAQRKDADILKNELALNIVRTSHYPQSRHFLDRCDEIGLLVFEEIPGWQHIGNDAWKRIALQNVEDMIIRDRNRPSIIIWGVRINESKDDHDFYTATNQKAHQLDPHRQTGGVRWHEHSEMLEDVYTVNDFIHQGDNLFIRDPLQVTGTPQNVPYLITEFGGHMYPTKRFDQEERLIKHALWHGNILSAAALDPHISGAIGWCAFDYNTHYQLGSGDRICYHGVMDMFRIPKMAAYLYKSQQSPDIETILFPATYWAFGERSIGGVSPLVIFTNCDKVLLNMNAKQIGVFTPDKENFAGLSHPPIVIPQIEGNWGLDWQDAEIIGYYKNEIVSTKKFVKNPVPTTLSVKPDDLYLDADSSDVTRVVVQILDQEKNILPYYFSPIQIDVTGSCELIGPSNVSLIGGCYAFWIRSNGLTGISKVTVEEAQLGTVDFIVMCRHI